ncbi:MAG: thioredoxin domain-containing protein [Bacteroidota bacterium]
MLRSVLLAPLALALFAAFPASGSDAPPADDAEVYAVVFYADWCGNCRILDPKVMEVWPSFADEPIQMVKLDFTDAETTEAAEALAAEHGLSDVLAADAGKTGFIVLVDAESGEEVDRIGARDSVSEIRAKLTAALG